MFQRLIRLSINHKLAVGLLTLLLAVWGAWSLAGLPFDSTPDITNNQVQVIAQVPSLGAQEVEQFITTPVEMALANIPRVTERRSISRSGLAVITLVFDDDADTYWARQQVSQQLKEAEESLPQGKGSVALAPVTTGLGEIYHYTLRARKGYEQRYSLTDLRTMQDWIVRKQLAGTEGVAEVSGWGGYVKQYEVAIDADRLQAAGLTVADVYEALEAGNGNTGGSYIEKNSNQYFIRGLGRAASLADIGNTAIRTAADGSAPVRVCDVARVQMGHATRYGAVTRNGEGEVVAGITLMLKGENFQQVIKNVKQRIGQIQRSLPEGVVIEPFIDRTQLVDRVTGTIARNLAEGGLIVVFILVLFLGNYRAGLIVASVIPLAMLFAFGMMRLTGISGNLMSLGAIDFGLIVDGAVIIVEAVCHHIATGTTGTKAAEGAVPGAGTMLTRTQMDSEVFRSASKIRQSAAFGEIIIMTVYLPLLTLSGIEGKMFRPMALTIFFAILGAFILSLTYVPMASALFLSRQTGHRTNISDRLIARLKGWYRPVITWCLSHSRTLIASMCVLFVGTLLLFGRLGGEFIPSLEEGDFAAEISMAQGTSLSQMVTTTTAAEKILKAQFPEVRQAVTRIGSSEIPTDPMPVERADLLIALKPKAEWTSASTTAELMEKMEQALSVIPGMDVEMTQPIQMRNNELITGIKQDVAIKIYGHDLNALESAARQVARLIRGVDGVSEPTVEKVQGLPQVQVRYDRDRLALYGISIATANEVLEAAFAGRRTGVVYEDDRSFDVVVRMDNGLRNDLQALSGLFLPVPGGGSVPLGQVADITMADAPAQITHENGQRRIYVGFNVRGRDVQRTVEDIQAILDRHLQLPAGYYYTYGGEFQNLQEASNRLLVAVPLALLVIVGLLFATLRNLRETVFVFSAIPLSAIGGVWALWLRGMPFSISAGVGFIALFGVAVLNGIVLIGQFNAFEREGVTDVRQRVIDGCMLRLRPVLMTALVASLGFLPMALSTGDGAEVQRPLATVVIGGLLTATVLTLLVLPAIYMTFTKGGTGGARNIKEISKMTKRRHITSVVWAVVLMATPATALAQATGSEGQQMRLTLQECISMALQNNLQIKADEIAADKARDLQGTAFDLEKTSVALSQDATAGGSPDNGITVSQAFGFPTVYAARRRYLQAETAVARKQVALTRSGVTRDVSACYYTLLHAVRTMQILQRQDSVYRHFAAIAAARYAAGESSQLERINADRLCSETAIRRQKAETDWRAAGLLLQALTNGGAYIVPADTLAPLRLQQVPAALSFVQTPGGEMAAARVTAAERSLRLAKQGYLPNLNIGLTGQMVISGFNPYHVDRARFEKGNFMAFEVGVSVPLFWGAQRARVKAARRDVALAETAQQQAAQQAARQYRDACNEVRRAAQVLAYYEGEGCSSAQRMARLAQTAYENGEIGYVEYMQNQQTAFEVQLQQADAVNDYNQAVIRLNYIGGF